MTRDDYQALIAARERRNWPRPLTVEQIFQGDFTDYTGRRAAYLEEKDNPNIRAGFARDLMTAVLWTDERNCQVFGNENYNKTWRLWQIAPDSLMRQAVWYE